MSVPAARSAALAAECIEGDGDEPGKVRLTSGGAFRIAHEEAGRAIGWRPLVDMREGLRRLIAWREERPDTD